MKVLVGIVVTHVKILSKKTETVSGHIGKQFSIDSLKEGPE